MDKATTCEDRRYLFEISREDVLDMVIAQHSGIKEALRVPGLKFMGEGGRMDVCVLLYILLYVCTYMDMCMYV